MTQIRIGIQWTLLLLETLLLVSSVLFLGTNGDYGTLLARFRNTADHTMTLWWICTPSAECDHGIRFFGSLPPNGGHTSFTTYVGHVFYWARTGKQLNERLQQFTISKDKILYVYSDETSSSNSQLIRDTKSEISFLEDYYNDYGKHWLSPFGRPPPRLPFVFNLNNFLTNNYVHVTSKERYWLCGDETDPKCRSNVGKEEFEIEELNNGFPKLYRISDFVSDYESRHLVSTANKFMQRSRVGDGSDSRLDPTRTSTNCWLAMNRTKIIETIYRRMGDVLGIDSYRMTADSIFNTKHSRFRDDTGVASHLEIVHFSTHEHYSPHYDNAPGKEVNLHFITFQIILSTSTDFRGGQTAFPHAILTDNGKRGAIEGLSIESEPLSAIFWYNLLEDGNLDESALYSNTEVLSGDQWMGHVSIWDPSLPAKGDPRMEHDFVYSMHDEL